MSRRVSFNYQSANDVREMRHAQAVMNELADKHGFRIIESEPFPIGDCFHFWLEDAERVEFPSYISEVTP